MDLAELRKQPHLSASSISDYIECGLLYRFSRVDKLKPKFRADAMVFGSAIHKTIAHFHQERMTGYLLPLAELQLTFENEWRDAVKGNIPIRYTKGKDFQTLVGEGKEYLKVYHENFSGEGFEVLAIEEPFSYSVDGLPVPIIGAYDLVEVDSAGTIVISDFKTAGHAYSTDEVERNFQMTVYHMAARSNGYHDREVLLRFDCLIKTKQPKFKQYYSARSADDEKRAVRKMREVWNGINKGVFIANDTSWKCSGCGYKGYCDEWLEG